MIDSINRIAAYVRNMSYDEFMADLKTQDAVIRNIEIIGEAAKQLPKSRPSLSQIMDPSFVRAVPRHYASRMPPHRHPMEPALKCSYSGL